MMLIVGFGNTDRQDDAAGVLAVRQLHGRTPEDTMVMEAGLDILALLDKWPERGAVILIDAVVTGAPPGTVHRWTADNIPPTIRTGHASSHGFSLMELVSLGHELRGGEPFVCFIGVEAQGFQPGAELSEAVAEAIPLAVATVLKEVDACMNMA